MKKTIFIFSIIISFGLLSCEKDIDPGLAPNSKLAGHWTVNEYDLEMNEVYGPSHLYTYNTSFDADSIWIDNIYNSGIKLKAYVESETSFSRTGGRDINHSIASVASINISEAKIIGDSIIFRVTLYRADMSIYDDYYEAGHRTTGWDGDTH